MLNKKFIFITMFAGIVSYTYASIPYRLSYQVVSKTEAAIPAEEIQLAQTESTPESPTTEALDPSETTESVLKEEEIVEQTVEEVTENTSDVFSVPFYSQFTDITPAPWKKIGCGIASLAMLIDFYEPGEVVVDALLNEGIAANAYLSNAGWTHAGLIGLSKKYGLTGESKDMAGSSMKAAFSTLKDVLEEGPVMVSVHYTFDPQNPIPHLVVVNGVADGKVYYNDPAETSGGGSISIAQFQSAWKKRYIAIRPS